MVLDGRLNPAKSRGEGLNSDSLSFGSVERLVKFVSNHHHSEELRQSTADSIMVALSALFNGWPAVREGLSSKEILLLHELDELLPLAPLQMRGRVALACAPMLCRCFGSDNSRVAERALTLFAGAAVREVLLSGGGALPMFLHALERVPWV